MSEPNKKNNEKVDEDFTAEILILEDLGVDEDKIKKINNKETALKVVKYYQNKAEKEATKNHLLKLKANLGHTPDKLPDAEDIAIKDYKLTLNEKLDPLSAKHAYNNRYMNNSRISVIFTAKHPNGRCF